MGMGRLGDGRLKLPDASSAVGGDTLIEFS